MSSTLEPLQQLSIEHPFDIPSGGDEYQPQFDAAEREMGAFVVAVGRLFGPAAAEHAAEYWVELAETADLPEGHRRHEWRLITIRAASDLAMAIGVQMGRTQPR